MESVEQGDGHEEEPVQRGSTHWKPARAGSRQANGGGARRVPQRDAVHLAHAHAHALLAVWHSDYNNVRPHTGLGGATPVEVATRIPLKAAPGHAPVAINARSGHHMRGLPPGAKEAWGAGQPV
ncbi:transposase [Azospirillum sp. Vi22]|nr:transposase [Azospirillum baldaniorum]